MAQSLFAPPNVKGWPGGKSWLTTATLLERSNFAWAFVSGSLWIPSDTSFAVAEGVPPPRALDPIRVVDDAGAKTPAAIVVALVNAFLPGGIRPAAEAKLVTFLAEGGALREAVHAVLTLPEAQLV